VADDPRLSVVVPTYQRREVVLQTVRALAAQEGAPRYEVIVVVDGSTDGTAAALRGLSTPMSLTVIEQPNQGAAAARNRGAEVACGQILLFLDDDMEADSRLLAEHARAHEDGARVVLGHIPLHPDSPRGFLSASVGAWAEERCQKLSGQDAPIDLDEFLTGQVSIARDIFREVGGFDLRFTQGGTFGCEDLDIGRRLERAGYEIVFDAKAISRQRYVVTPRQHLRQWHQNGAAKVALARKHPDQAERIFWRRERRADRYVWRWLRWPRRELVLGLLGARVENRWTIRWFRRVRDLEYFTGIREAGGEPSRRPVRIICYHAIADLKGSGELEQFGIPPDRFRRQLRRAGRHLRFIDAEEFRRYLDGAGVTRRAALLTFDDCYADLESAALPVLRELRIPAVAFAVSGLTGKTSEWVARNGVPVPLLDAEGLRRLEKCGVAIGAHSQTHPRLDRLPAAVAAAEIKGSIADLETLGLERPQFFAYPFGALNAELKEVARAAGLAGAFSTRPGLAEPDGDRFAIPRIEILRRDRGPRFLLKVLGGRRLRRS
jgi:GT2 family glycosyltransferase/peptidoglycan/xylan/chitin deacetylase (PgdA/CDA1 family)